MFSTEILKLESEFSDYFNFQLIKTIKSSIIDYERSEIVMLNDFIIISLLSNNNISCPFSIYYGVRNSLGYYSLIINKKAIVYNYEHFSSYELFEKELIYFFSNKVRQETLKDKNGDIVYSDYFVKNYNDKHEFFFREYNTAKWTNFFRAKKTKISIHYFEPWI